MSRAGRLSRRGALVVAGLTVAGCAASQEPSPPSGASPTPSPTPPPDPTGSATPEPEPARLPEARVWQPTADEIDPDAKVVASREVERLGAGPRRVTNIVYPQYGGLEATTASVMIVAREVRLAGGSLQRTLGVSDVRLARAGGTADGAWQVAEVIRAPDRRPGRLTRAARRLVSDERVQLPAPAVGDLRAGAVEPLVVDILNDLAGDFEMSVAVFASGHPPNVFGTDGLSNHTRGRAVDVWAVDGRPVVEMSLDDPLLTRFLDAVRERGSTEVGGPIIPPGDTGVHFANDLHRDHVHIGFDP